jgi:hypothetical protein
MTEVIELPIERFEAFEEKLGIRLEGLFAFLNKDSGTITINGDLYANDDDIIKEQNLKLVISCHDVSSRVIAKSSESVSTKSFVGIYTFSTYFQLKFFLESIAKVRIYPQPA